MNQAAKTGELIKVPNTLKNKIGGRMGKVNHAAIAKAEAASSSLSSNFEEWVADEVTKLEEARRKVDDGELSSPSGKELFGVSHDLKGLGTTYGYPLITQIADSLCGIIHTQELREKAPLRLVDAHVDAISAAIRGKIKDANHPVGSVLSSELRKKTREFLDTI